jgi:hypothetical protein
VRGYKKLGMVEIFVVKDEIKVVIGMALHEIHNFVGDYNM